VSTAAAPVPLRLGLVGSPNSGKTTLFNALTGLRAKVGNYPGVTVERREGSATFEGRRSVVIDLPGSYSLSPVSPDEEVVVRVLDGKLNGVPQALAVVADANTLERSLLMLAQILHREIPTCLVLTMTDEFRARGGRLDIPRLERALGIPVIGVVGHRGIGIAKLKRLFAKPEEWSRPHVMPPTDVLDRAGWVESILEHVLTRHPGRSRKSDAIDRIVLHPLIGPLLFAAVMVAFFQLIFAWAQPAMDFIDAGVASLGSFVHAQLPAGLLADFLADGLIAGVGSVIIFVPQIALLFTLLYFLQDIGYMARAAFVIDRVMAGVGLEGRAFVSLLSSYACAVPGIMATRTIPSPRHRLVTILVAPLMTCSARLPVYALSLLTRTLLREDAMPFYMELPPYRMPTAKLLFGQVWRSVWAFLRRAGTIILAVSIILWCLLTFPQRQAPPDASPAEARRYAIEHSFAGQAGHAIEPLIEPLGFDWKIGIGLVASLAAREVIVATLAQIYAATDEDASLRAAVQNDIDPRTGQKVFDAATVASLLVFFIFALQCMSTLAVMRRETNSWRWPAFAFGYLLILAYAASFGAHQLVERLLG
jgi:ferrous iron transport protein B